MTDKVVKPNHYEMHKIEPITFIMENELDFASGNAIKYIMRAGHKQYDDLNEIDSHVTDLRKAIRYLEMRINLITGQEVTR